MEATVTGRLQGLRMADTGKSISVDVFVPGTVGGVRATTAGMYVKETDDAAFKAFRAVLDSGTDPFGMVLTAVVDAGAFTNDRGDRARLSCRIAHVLDLQASNGNGKGH